MAHLAGHGRAKYTTGTLLGSSRDRGWNGLLAERWSHSEGELGEVRPRETEIVVMLEGRVHVRRRGDGRLQHHDAVPGTVWLCPAGIREDMIRVYGDIPETVHIYLPASPLSATALRDLDVDPDTVGLHYDGGFRDPLIEHIARAVHTEMTRSGTRREDARRDPRVRARRPCPQASFEPGARDGLPAEPPRRARSPASPPGDGVHRSPSERGPDNRGAGHGSLSQPVPFRPHLQGGDRDRRRTAT